jgi:hypothetical protein
MTTNVGERIMRVLARVPVRVFFRRIDLSGAKRLPGGPTVVVDNHTNGIGRRVVVDRQPGALPEVPRQGRSLRAGLRQITDK